MCGVVLDIRIRKFFCLDLDALETHAARCVMIPIAVVVCVMGVWCTVYLTDTLLRVGQISQHNPSLLELTVECIEVFAA